MQTIKKTRSSSDVDNFLLFEVLEMLITSPLSRFEKPENSPLKYKNKIQQELWL